jgi:hypothetical protein
MTLGLTLVKVLAVTGEIFRNIQYFLIDRYYPHSCRKGLFQKSSKS